MELPRRLFARVDASSLAFFRIAFGVVLVWEVARYFEAGWIREYYVEPGFHFTFAPFAWVRPWPGNGMEVHFLALGLVGVAVAVGYSYRLASALAFLGFTYVFLLEQARYLNHFYLLVLLSFLLPFLPANRAWSLDARGSRGDRTVPAWSVYLVRFQVAVPYFFGGVAKLNSDWLRGEPIREWLAERDDFPLIGRFFTDEWMVHLFAYGGLFIDLLCPFFLLHRRTRTAAFLLFVSFHFLNTRLFDIGIFPWFMLLGTTIFFPADWPRRLLHDVWARPSRAGVTALIAAMLGGFTATWFRGGPEIVPFLCGAVSGALLVLSASGRLDEPPPARLPARVPRRAPLVVGALGLWVLVQVTLPLRHYLIPGNVHWTEEGHRFAWHMKLRDKQGRVVFLVKDRRDGSSTTVDPRKELTSWQARKMATRPYLIHKYARHIERTLAAEGRPDVEIRARTSVSLNGRKRQPLVDADVDLTKVELSFWKDPWVLPLEERLPGHVPLRKPGERAGEDDD